MSNLRIEIVTYTYYFPVFFHSCSNEGKQSKKTPTHISLVEPQIPETLQNNSGKFSPAHILQVNIDQLILHLLI